MSDKKLIVYLIKQDFQHSQLTYGLNRLGLEHRGKHSLQILELVCELMKVPDGKISDHLGRVYVEFQEQASYLKIEELGRSLDQIVEECYNSLLEIQKTSV